MSSPETGHTEPVGLDFPIEAYDISPDGKRVVLAVRDAGNKSHLWLVSLDRRVPPHQIRPTPASDSRPVYGPGGQLFFQTEEAGSAFICQMERRRQWSAKGDSPADWSNFKEYRRTVNGS